MMNYQIVLALLLSYSSYHGVHGQVCTKGEVANGKPAYQSSTWPIHRGCASATAGLAVDGDTNPKRFEGCSCSHTNQPMTEPPWWIVDLTGMHIIYNVIIYNRAENYGYKLNNFYVAVGSSFNKATFNPDGYGEICKFMPGARSDGEIIDVICDQPMIGRYVTIFMKTIDHPLQLCEVEVMGSLVEGAISGINKEPLQGLEPLQGILMME